MNGVWWSLRRELWESRSLYVAPLAVAALAFFAAVIRILAQRETDIRAPYELGEGVIMFTTLVVSVFYAVDALYGERRDRSVLFWKSMPVSDLTTVLTKASIPIVFIPLITFATTVALHIPMALIGMARSGNAVAYWDRLSLPEMWGGLLYHLLTLHGIAWAPFFGWLLFASAFARRAPFVWAVVPPLAVALLERIAFGTSYFAQMLAQQSVANGGMTSRGELIGHPMPGMFFAWPGWWIGLIVAGGFIAAAARLRR